MSINFSGPWCKVKTRGLAIGIEYIWEGKIVLAFGPWVLNIDWRKDSHG